MLQRMAQHRGAAAKHSPRRVLAISVLAALLMACTGDDGAAPTTTTVSAPETTTSAPAADDPALRALLLTPADLPAGFAPSADVDDTVTSFCAGQDAAGGLRATGRELVGFTRTPPGASVIHLAFRFTGTGAADFVDQAEALFSTCSDVPDITGLAFTYSPLSPALEAVLAAGTQRHVARYGVSVGSGNLTVDIAVIQQDDVGILVAVLGLEQDRAALDELANAAFAAAIARLGA